MRGCLRVRQVDANLGKLRELHQLEFNSEQLSYSFRSSLMRDVIYTSMTYENRKALHTAAADLLLQGGKSSHTKYLAAHYHLRQAEDEPRVLRLTTDAAQQAPAAPPPARVGRAAACLGTAWTQPGARALTGTAGEQPL